MVGIVRFRVIVFSPPSLRDGYWLLTTKLSIRGELDTFLQKIDQPAEQADGWFAVQVDILKGSAIAGRPGGQSGCGGERWTGGQFGQAAQRRRTAEADLPAEHPGRHLTNAGKLAGAA